MYRSEEGYSVITKEELFNKLDEIGNRKAINVTNMLEFGSASDGALAMLILVNEWMDEEIIGGWKEHARWLVNSAIPMLMTERPHV